VELQFDLSKPSPVSGSADHDDQIIVEFGELMILIVVEHEPLADRFQGRELLQRLTADHAAQ
jgi:hypothetical protein